MKTAVEVVFVQCYDDHSNVTTRGVFIYLEGTWLWMNKVLIF